MTSYYLKVIATFLLLSSNFALLLQYYLMDLHHASDSEWIEQPDDLLQLLWYCDL